MYKFQICSGTSLLRPFGVQRYDFLLERQLAKGGKCCKTCQIIALLTLFNAQRLDTQPFSSHFDANLPVPQRQIWGFAERAEYYC